MGDVKWIKIVTDIFDDEKILLIESLPEADSIIVIWFKLLCLAGKQNNSGVFVMSNGLAYTDAMLATIFRRKEATVSLALKTFEQFGMIEIINDAITIPNWSKHQTLDQLEERKEYMREYMKKYREKQKLLTDGEGKVNCKVNSKVNVNSLDKEEEIEEEIEKNKNKRKVSKKESFDDLIDNYTCDEELRTELKNHLATRKNKKATLTNRAIELSLKKLDELTENVPINEAEAVKIKIVQQSIERGWTSFFELKKNNAKKTNDGWDYLNEEFDKVRNDLF